MSELVRQSVDSLFRSQGMLNREELNCVSFEVMRRSRLTRAFAFDRHFAEQGFQQIP